MHDGRPALSRPEEASMAKVAIVGCGAMGSVYAALMADAGHEVHAVTLWPDNAEAMRTQGLRVESASGGRTVRLASAGTDTNGIGPCDLAVIATKAFDVEAAARSSVKLLGPDTVVRTIQNGLLAGGRRSHPWEGPDCRRRRRRLRGLGAGARTRASQRHGNDPVRSLRRITDPVAAGLRSDLG